MSIEKELLDFKEKIDNAQTEGSKFEGKKEQLMTNLEDRFNLTSTSKAHKILKESKESLKDLKEEIVSGLENFEDKYGEPLNEF